MKTVLVTGITGFIAGHVARELLERGYRVRGTTRSLEAETRLRSLYEGLGHGADRLEVIELDLEVDEGWRDAMAGCDFVQHIASPFPMAEPADKMALVPPAREGALRVLKYAREAGIPKVVLTSSTVAVTNRSDKQPGYVYTETDWSDTQSKDIRAYSLSKTLAEQAAWHDVETHGGPQLTVMNPSFVVGPLLDDTISTSGELIRQFFKGKYPAVPRLCFGIVDVRDVATAHVNAMESESASGKRYLLSAGTMEMIDIARTLRAAFPAEGGKLPRFQASRALMHVLALFDRSVRGILPEIGRVYELDSALAQQELKVDFISRENGLIEMGRSLINRQMI